MDKKEVLDFITTYPTAFMATVDDGKPHVRAMGTYRADENGIIFSMPSPKDVYKQLIKNPEVELCYYADGIQVRVSGRARKVTNMALKKEIVEKRPFYKPDIDEKGWDFLGAVIIKNGKAAVTNMKEPPPEPGAPKTYIDL